MKKICLSFLILFPVYANAVLLPVGKPTENGHQTYWSTDEKKYVHKWDMEQRDRYISRSAASGHIEAGGKKSANSVGGTVKQSVSKKTVFANLYKNAKSGGKYIGRVAGIFGWLYMAYELINPILVKDGWVYDKDEQNWVRYNNVGFAGFKSGRTGVPSGQSNSTIEQVCKTYDCDVYHVFRQENPTKENVRPEAEKACSKMPVDDKKLSTNLDGSYYKAVSPARLGGQVLSQLVFNCVAETYLFDKNGAKVRLSNAELSIGRIILYTSENSKTNLSQQEFDDLVEPEADKQPNPFVERSKPTEESEVPGIKTDEVKVPKGTVAQTSPYTNEQGQAEQTRWDFGEDSEGKTTDKETRIPRPDIQPDSPGAPRPNPNPNPDGNPNPNPDPDGNPNPNPDNKPDDKPPSDSFLCMLFPDILACDQLTEPEQVDLDVPEETIDLSFKPDSVFSSSGQCPAPVRFEAMGARYEISLEPACTLAEMMRPFIIAMAWLVAAFFVARVVRNNA